MSAFDSAGDPIRDEGTAVWKINGVEYTSKVKHGRNEFKVSDYLDYTLDEANVITLTVRMNTGGSRESVVSKKWYITAINLSLTWKRDYSETNYITGSSFNLTFFPYGNVDCTAHIIFDNTFTDGVTYFKEEIAAHETGKQYTTKNPMPSLSYGSHTCEIYLTATIISYGNVL